MLKNINYKKISVIVVLALIGMFSGYLGVSSPQFKTYAKLELPFYAPPA